jgi:hypothetical protein
MDGPGGFPDIKRPQYGKRRAMADQRQQWLEFLAAERRRRVEHRAPHDNVAERLEAELDEMYRRLVAGTAGPSWSPDGDVSIAERVAMFGRWPPGCVVDPEREAAEFQRWFTEHGYS